VPVSSPGPSLVAAGRGAKNTHIRESVSIAEPRMMKSGALQRHIISPREVENSSGSTVKMAKEQVPLGSPPAMAVASAAVLIALIDELINQQSISREGAERLLGVARQAIGMHSTQPPFAEARNFVGSMQQNISSA
jgi:hypothetical protein